MMIMPKNNNDVSGNIGKIIKVGMSDFSYFFSQPSSCQY